MADAKAAPPAIAVGGPAPDFCRNDTYGRKHCLKDYRGRWVVLYFYPKDNTPGCVIEAVDFTALKGEFEGQGAVVLGMSPDSEESHKGFTDRRDLKITLLSDPGHEVMAAYGGFVERALFGRGFLGVVRSTVLIDPEGKVAYHWPKVTATGHAAEVLAKLKELRR